MRTWQIGSLPLHVSWQPLLHELDIHASAALFKPNTSECCTPTGWLSLLSILHSAPCNPATKETSSAYCRGLGGHRSFAGVTPLTCTFGRLLQRPKFVKCQECLSSKHKRRQTTVYVAVSKHVPSTQVKVFSTTLL